MIISSSAVNSHFSTVLFEAVLHEPMIFLHRLPFIGAFEVMKVHSALSFSAAALDCVPLSDTTDRDSPRLAVNCL